MKNKRAVSVLCIAVMLFVLLTACGQSAGQSNGVNIRFNENFNFQKYDGKQVVMRGYMSVISPIDGRFIYLMNIPYQNCPFCIPNTTQVVNTMAVYSKTGAPFAFYDGPIEVTGILKMEDSVDEFGYELPYKIVDAEYTRLDTTVLSDNLKIYGALAQDGIITDIVMMMDQVDTNAFFGPYYGMTEDDIKIVTDSEFDNIIRRVNAISETDYTYLIAMVMDFKAFNQVVNRNIEKGAYDENSTQEMRFAFMGLTNIFYEWLNLFVI